MNYTIEEYNTSGIVMTDENGDVCIKTPEMSESQELTITFTSPYGIEITDNVKIANIIVESLSFTQSWKGQVGIDGELGASAGAGIEAGILGAEASAASASISGGLSRGIALENSYDNGERELKISSTIGGEAGAKYSAGLWATGDIMDIAKVKVSPLELSGNACVVSDITKSLIIDNYDPTNPAHLSQIAMFLIDNNSNNIIAQIVYRIMNAETYNEEEITQTIKISGGADVGKVKLSVGDDTDVGEFTLFSVGPHSAQTLSSSKNLDDGSFTFGNALSTSIGYDLLQINSLGIDHKIDDDTSVSADVSTEKGFGFWGRFINNNIQFESEVNSGQFKKFTVTALEEEEVNSSFFSLGEKVSTIEKNVIYKDGQAKSLLESDSTLTSLGLGTYGTISVMDLANIFNSIAEANVQGQYERNKKYTQKYDISLGVGFEALVKLGLGFNLSGIYSDQFTYESGSVSNSGEQIQSVSTADKEFEASKTTLTQIVAEPFEYIAEVIAENVSNFVGKVSDGIEAVGAKLKGFCNYMAEIIFIDVPQAQTFSILSVAEEGDTFDTSSVATTVGKPYIVNIKDDNGNVVDDFSGTPLQLTLEYSADELNASKINNTIEDLYNLKIYRYDDKTGMFVYIGGELDYDNSSVTASITKSGQYILAFDNCAPSVTNFTVTNGTTKPTFKATVADMSGICDFSFKIDGKEYVNDENLSECYTPNNAVFEYQMTEELADGEHTATITASDSVGNVMVNSMFVKFNVDTSAPVIENLNISNEIVDGKINVSAIVTDDNINSIKAYVDTSDNIHTYNLTETDGVWSAEIDVADERSVTIWVIAYDNAGNSTQSEKKPVIGHMKGDIRQIINKAGYDKEAKLVNTEVFVYNNGDNEQSFVMFLGLYKNGDLVGVDLKKESVPTNGRIKVYGAIPLEEDRGGYVIKSFVWRDLETQMPLCNKDELICENFIFDCVKYHMSARWDEEWSRKLGLN